MKRCICILVMMCLCVSLWAIPAYADGEKKTGLFTYELKGNGNAVITGFDWNANRSDDIYIPRQIDGYNVTEIGAYAFSSSKAGIDSAIDVENTDTIKNIIGNEVVVVLL